MKSGLNYLTGKTILIISRIRITINGQLKNNLNQVKLSIQRDIQLPEKILKSVVNIEDKRFYKHIGVDIYSICRAISRYIFFNKLEGASTIEQQFIRSSTNNREISIRRKINEICLAVLISKEYSKSVILNSYLSKYTFNNVEGILQLCSDENYDLNQISDFEAASIAARLKYPYINTNNYIRYLKRVRTVEIKNNT